MRRMPIPVGELFGERAGLKHSGLEFQAATSRALFSSALAFIQKCETYATATQRFCITEPSIRKN